MDIQVFEVIRGMEREKTRMEDGTYVPLPIDKPWFLEVQEKFGHFVHYSAKKPGRLAYTQSVEKLVDDVQTPITPELYFSKECFGLVPADEIYEAIEVIKANHPLGSEEKDSEDYED